MRSPSSLCRCCTVAQRPARAIGIHIVSDHRVLGGTGCGKTSFCNAASGSSLKVSHGLRSCTTELQTVELVLDEQPVILIDTPGFDDTVKPQALVLKEIATSLRLLFQGERNVDGLIYMHRISDIRMGGTSLNIYRIFSKLCGAGAMKNVVIATTMWSQVRAEVGRTREEELRNNYFKNALDRGARMASHDGSKDSAIKIITDLLAIMTEPQMLQVQDDMVIQRKAIHDTEAGMQLDKELDQLILDLQSGNLSESPTEKLQQAQTALEREKASLRTDVDEEVVTRLQTLFGQMFEAPSSQPARPESSNVIQPGHDVAHNLMHDALLAQNLPAQSPPEHYQSQPPQPTCSFSDQISRLGDPSKSLSTHVVPTLSDDPNCQTRVDFQHTQTNSRVEHSPEKSKEENSICGCCVAM
ncbi:hypothetical protein WOLCODRAFT_119951 [Wolfiporia cocos MD-104 SS10]|uniref:G domain-containing protein n=1 Tax=Wolfiporia cocos (strain MD-104) TaxID=742152 RepID=A0A2H3JZD8_WOLCO|nr:hypothetical protein WOLCODRAFT_119951 [Wolfiporia cocos MD-104 SS10]